MFDIKSIFFIIVIFATIAYFFFFKKQDNLTQKKILKYFGGDYCPHSNSDSRIFRLINEDFRQKYPDVDIQIFWSSDENREEFQRAGAEYVPTITNSSYEHLRVGLPESIDTTDKSDEELKQLVLINLKNQLDM
jgi:hypothetical protein